MKLYKEMFSLGLAYTHLLKLAMPHKRKSMIYSRKNYNAKIVLRINHDLCKLVHWMQPRGHMDYDEGLELKNYLILSSQIS